MTAIRYLLAAIFFWGIPIWAGTAVPTPVPEAKAAFPSIDWQRSTPWVDSVMNTLTLDEKIGQLFMVPVYAREGQQALEEALAQIKEYHIGGIIFMQGGPVRQIHMVNKLQAASPVPLLVAQDAEWGLGMRLDSTWSFPRQLTLGALRDPTLVYDMGAMIAAHCRRVGVHLNFAPVVDINNNRENPVINDRSFGENRYNVALRGIQYMKGMQDHGVLACAKHFPGHGDTDKDSHKDLPVIAHDTARLDSLELFPFRFMIHQGVMSVMTAHLYVPQLEPTANLAASLSPRIVHDLLQQEMGFDGLVITDALNMQGAREHTQPGELEVMALEAGNDILLFPSELSLARQSIREALESGRLTIDRINRSVRKILLAKEWAGVHQFQPLSDRQVYADLINAEVKALHRKLVAGALTIAQDAGRWLPFQMVDTTSFAVIEIGTPSDALQASFKRYVKATYFQIGKNEGGSKQNKLLNAVDSFERVIVVHHDMSRYSSRNYGITNVTRQLIERLAARTSTVLCLMGTPYSLTYFEDVPATVVAYEDTRISNDLVPQLLFGGLPARGQLPVSASQLYRYGRGRTTQAIRLSYGLPEELGLSGRDMSQIDSIALEAIAAGATPGCQVYVAKAGKVIYQKSFGYHTYAKRQPVDNYDLYDLASITKVAATTLSLMYLTEIGMFDLDLHLSDYVPELYGTNLSDIPIREVLTHTAGLTSWIPFYKATIQPDIYDVYYCDKRDSTFCVPVARNVYMRGDYRDSIMAIIAHSELHDIGEYDYSDLGFYLFKQIIENTTQSPINEFTRDMFYKPLGLRYLTYLPLEKFPPAQIVPTEKDRYFRKQLLDGYVHDPGAAMWGGVSGHAGLFSNTNDLGILMQMLLNGGTYGGERFLKASTIQQFTRKQHDRSRRGLGFDKPELDKRVEGPTSTLASPATFGHTGFTGTCVWVDPAHDLVYVFLSNRIHPSASNLKLIKMDIRTRIQTKIYEAIFAAQRQETAQVLPDK